MAKDEICLLLACESLCPPLQVYKCDQEVGKCTATLTAPGVGQSKADCTTKQSKSCARQGCECQGLQVASISQTQITLMMQQHYAWS